MEMDTEFKYNASLRSLCEGCLSSDRKLQLISDVEIENFFRSISEKFDHITHPVILCWECVALIKKTLKYIKQVRQAQQILAQYVLHTSLQPLTALTTTPPVLLDITPSPSDSGGVKCERVGQNEVAFIKVESSEDQYYLDDDFCEAVVSSPVYHGDGFNASDDEPLTKVKQQAEEPKRRRGRPRKSDAPVERVRKRKEKCGVVKNARVEKKLEELNVAPGQLEMVVLTWEEVEEERQKALSSPPFTTLRYKCYHCAVGFSHKFKLENHMKKHDPSCGGLVCSACGVRCGDSAPALAAHRRRHRVRWRCVCCGRVFSRASVAADHVSREHGAPPPTHHCPLCHHTYTSLSCLRRHARSHAPPRACPLCDKLFPDNTALRTHLFIHKGEKEFGCPKCDKKFLFKKAMEIHLETHNESANLYCHECDLNFKNKMSFYQHMKYNLKHIDPAKLKYACHLCDKKFAKASRLNEHNLGVHLKITPFKCTFEGCTLSFSSRPARRTHIRMIHRGARAHRNHVCHTCGKTYTSRKVLEGHLLVHGAARPLQCAACPASFRCRGALHNHQRRVHQHKKRAAPSPSPR